MEDSSAWMLVGQIQSVRGAARGAFLSAIRFNRRTSAVVSGGAMHCLAPRASRLHMAEEPQRVVIGWSGAPLRQICLLCEKNLSNWSPYTVPCLAGDTVYGAKAAKFFC